ncbi:hypothetical protein OXX80_008566 [Metschnikowia pulcherrima]
MKLLAIYYAQAILSLIVAGSLSAGESNETDSRKPINFSDFEDVYFFKSSSDCPCEHPTLTMTAELHFQLDVFISKLKTYLQATHFDPSDFESNITFLESELQIIVDQAEHLHAPTENLLHQLKFAKYMLHAMILATEQLGRFNNLGLPEHQLITHLLELNVLIFNCYNTSGKPDRAVYEHPGRILSLWSRFRSLSSQFERLKNVPMRSRLIFESQRAQARQAIGCLWAQVTSDWESPFLAQENCF